MKVILESTSTIVTLEHGSERAMVRLWTGATDSGVNVFAYIASIMPETRDPAVHEQFASELIERAGAKVGPR